MCEVVAAAALQLRAPPALEQLQVRQMRLVGTRWPWPTAASSDSQAVPALALVASSALVAATAVSSALVRPAASDWLEVQPSSSDQQPPECHLTQRAAASRRHSQRGAAPAAAPVKTQLSAAAASHAPATRGLAAPERGASWRQEAAQLWASGAARGSRLCVRHLCCCAINSRSDPECATCSELSWGGKQADFARVCFCTY
jgi:hypothetical protein